MHAAVVVVDDASALVFKNRGDSTERRAMCYKIPVPAKNICGMPGY